MRVSLVAVMTADGFIARDAQELVDWRSEADRKLFVALTKRAGVVVMGANTFRTIGKALPGRKTIVYAHQTIDAEGVETTQESPQKLINRLEELGFSELAVCGGAEVYDLFLRAGLASDLYVTLEPKLFGRGISLAKLPLDIQLKLAEAPITHEDAVFLHYEVAAKPPVH